MYQRIKRVIPGSMIPGDARIAPLQRSPRSITGIWKCQI